MEQKTKKTTVLAVIPPCDLCLGDNKNPAYADAKMRKGTASGQWAYLCKKHFDACNCQLGTGLGQQLIQG